VLKVELHTHTDQDPLDRVPHSTRALIDRAAALGFQALAITLHDRYFHANDDAAYARERGILLIPGIERTIEGRHVLLLNFPAACADARTFEDVAALKASANGLVIAPHPFYPIPVSLGGALLDRHRDLFDAVEINAMYTRLVNFNVRAIRWARLHGKPLVGNTDLHLLSQLGSTYTSVDAPLEPGAICEAIRAGRVEVRTSPISTIQAALTLSRMIGMGLGGRISRTFAPRET
jgi:predicted metal-dependent phosphoesterase TrpH